MSKSAKKRASEPKKPAGAAAKPARGSTDTAKTAKADPSSKQSRVVAMLRSSTGATMAAMMKATGWQQHSVRGFLAGVIRKRLKLKLDSAKIDGTRVYRHVGGTAGKAASRQPAHRSR